MGNSLQQQSRLRKIVYTVLILVLFTGTLFFRRAPTYGVESQANNLELREQQLGEVELTGSAARLMLTGSRGLLVCALWWSAQQVQMKHEWNELEVLVRTVTKLQPHFVTPWLFQSWNLAYNVSVESDRVKDKYFYIASGSELLAEGERQNRNNPDLRFTMGFYSQHKIGLSDEQNTMRSLFQMSCMRPEDRDPNQLRTKDDRGRVVVNMARFEEFCQKHPMFVRRLRDYLRCERPEDVVDFLEANRKIPTRYEEEETSTAAARLKPMGVQYPLVPPGLEGEGELGPNMEFGDDVDNYAVARGWFKYAQKPLPPPESKPIMMQTDYDRTRYRMPRAMASQIFRGYPARGQTFVADTLEKEGWFDREGWLITGWFKDDKFSHGERSGDAVVGGDHNWAVDAWSRARQMWVEHGANAGLYLTPEQLKNLDDEAQLFRKTFNMQPSDRSPDTLPSDKQTPELVKSKDAHDQLYWYDRNRDMTNFPHFFYKSQVEMEPSAVHARKLFFQADALRKAGKRDEALEKYAEGMPIWRDLLKAHRDFRRDTIVMEDTYEVELQYLNLVRQLYGPRIKQLLVLQDFLAQAAARPALATVWLPPAPLVRTLEVDVVSPLDVMADDGQPLISRDARLRVRQRMGLPTGQPEPSSPPMPTTAPNP